MGALLWLWSGILALALVVTLVDVVLLVRVVDLCRQIQQLTRSTSKAARGIARNTEVPSTETLQRLADRAKQLNEQSRDLRHLPGIVRRIGRDDAR